MSRRFPLIPLFEALVAHPRDAVAFVESLSGERYSYGDLVSAVAGSKTYLAQTVSHSLVEGSRVVILIENSIDYLVALLSILASNCIAVPLAPGVPVPELAYSVQNSNASAIITSKTYESKAKDIIEELRESQPVVIPAFTCVHQKDPGGRPSAELESCQSDASGIMFYTSGTTSRPKGVILSLKSVMSQAGSLIRAWKYSPRDTLLHILPLHHIHGIIPALMVPLVSGSTVESLYPFSMNQMLERLAAPFLQSSGQRKTPISILTAVPTIYNLLLQTLPTLSAELREAVLTSLNIDNLRLCISGSAALPVPTQTAWSQLTNGNCLLERYGMSEVGMALSCGLHHSNRIYGSVGWPLPSVEVRLVDADTGEVILGDQKSGEIQIRGPTIFKGYWYNAEVTKASFIESADGSGRWFRTGDVAYRKWMDNVKKHDEEWIKGSPYFIEGRMSVDIIKSGGEKISALEIERELLSFPLRVILTLSKTQINEAAVFGLPSADWGEKIVAIVVLNPHDCASAKPGKKWNVADMRRALQTRLASQKVPQVLKVVDVISRNAMGKVDKKALRSLLFPENHIVS